MQKEKDWTELFGQFIDKLTDPDTPPPAEKGILWDSKQEVWMAFDYSEKEGFLEETSSYLDAVAWLKSDSDLYEVERMSLPEKLNILSE